MSLEDYSNYLIENLGVNEEVVNCITSIKVIFKHKKLIEREQKEHEKIKEKRGY